MDPVPVLGRWRGAARLETLINAGVTRGRLKRAVADGRVTRPLYGCYALPGASRAVILRASYRAELSCLSMCAAYGLPIIEHERKVHLWVPRDRARRADDRRPHQGVVLHRHDRETLNELDRIAVALDLMGRCCGRLQHIVAIDAALHKGLMTEADIDGFVHTDPARRDWLRARCDRKAESPLETITRVTLADEGLSVESQVPIDGAGRVDLLVEGRVVIQTDGKEHHNNPRAWIEDRRRDNACTDQHYQVFRFVYADVMGDRNGILDRVMNSLGRATV